VNVDVDPRADSGSEGDLGDDDSRENYYSAEGPGGQEGTVGNAAVAAAAAAAAMSEGSTEMVVSYNSSRHIMFCRHLVPAVLHFSSNLT